MHEYGHAIHDDQVPGLRHGSIDAGAIGESFGDYFAVSTGLAAAKQYGWPVNAEQACPMDWDATSYTSAPHCIRRFDTQPDRWPTVATRCTTTARSGARRSGRSARGTSPAKSTTAAWDTTLIESQFDYAPGTSFQAAAKATYDEAVAPRRHEVRHDRQGRVRPPRHHVLTRPGRHRRHDR